MDIQYSIDTNIFVKRPRIMLCKMQIRAQIMIFNSRLHVKFTCVIFLRLVQTLIERKGILLSKFQH